MVFVYGFLKVTDAQFSARAIRFPHNTPETKEAYYYRTVFHELFPQSIAEQ